MRKLCLVVPLILIIVGLASCASAQHGRCPTSRCGRSNWEDVDVQQCERLLAELRKRKDLLECLGMLEAITSVEALSQTGGVPVRESLFCELECGPSTPVRQISALILCRLNEPEIRKQLIHVCAALPEELQETLIYGFVCSHPLNVEAEISLREDEWRDRICKVLVQINNWDPLDVYGSAWGQCLAQTPAYTIRPVAACSLRAFVSFYDTDVQTGAPNRLTMTFLIERVFDRKVRASHRQRLMALLSERGRLSVEDVVSLLARYHEVECSEVRWRIRNLAYGYMSVAAVGNFMNVLRSDSTVPKGERSWIKTCLDEMGEVRRD